MLFSPHPNGISMTNDKLSTPPLEMITSYLAGHQLPLVVLRPSKTYSQTSFLILLSLTFLDVIFPRVLSLFYVFMLAGHGFIYV